MFEKKEITLASAVAGKLNSAKLKTSLVYKRPKNNDFIVRFARFTEKCESESCGCSKISLISLKLLQSFWEMALLSHFLPKSGRKE